MRLDHRSGLSIELPVVGDRAIRAEVIGIGWKTDPDVTSEFARDSPLERDGIELSVPRESATVSTPGRQRISIRLLTTGSSAPIPAPSAASGR